MTSKFKKWWGEWWKSIQNIRYSFTYEAVAEAAWNKSREDALEEAARLVVKMSGAIRSRTESRSHPCAEGRVT